ncbi:hypothetical protein [Streptomyces anulatus]|uniref:hypothetical protein n=1 Tax=Streptomyces anulatus TaxID=1892 RepID=UPI00386B1E35|nr:hypothetical protein OG238_03335 [Streptomyces anulatus]
MAMAFLQEFSGFLRMPCVGEPGRDPREPDHQSGQTPWFGFGHAAFDLDGLAFDLQAHIGPFGQIEERPHNTVG